MTVKKYSSFILVTLSIALASQGTVAQDTNVPESRPYELTEEREPCAHYTPTRRPFFGDTHIHTSYSFDANAQDTRNTPADAYRFAQGKPMGIQPYDENGNALREIQIDLPLDFTAISDHAEFLGEMNICRTPGKDGYWHPMCIIHRTNANWGLTGWGAMGLTLKDRYGLCGENNEHCFSEASSVWKKTQQHAEDAYDRSENCSFTSFVAYEWTATVGAGNNLHRNVIFRNDQVPDRPTSWLETPSAADLWDDLEANCVNSIEGCEALTIPHNSNLSGGYMFESARVASDEIPSEPLTAEEAKRRAYWEPMFEVMQHKGASECNPYNGFSEDELCNFEMLPYDNFGAKTSQQGGVFMDAMEAVMSRVDDSFVTEIKKPDNSNFMRYALAKGLQQQKELGANSFKFGVIASTDTHIAAPGLVAEKKHPGHGGAGGLGTADGLVVGLADQLEYGTGGLAVLWAEENNRDSLYSAMRRREAYGTSGNRPVVRFFGGWEYDQDLCSASDMVEQGYANGVPMGSDLPQATTTAPVFITSALKDPRPGTDLQRIQIIKGWLEGNDIKEQVLNVAGGDNGASVDINTCEQQGHGDSNLCSVWTDPDFNSEEPAYYYARVVENPSCRWSQYQCIDAKVDCSDPDSVPEEFSGCCSADHQPAIQERAWTSPIWYTPANKP